MSGKLPCVCDICNCGKHRCPHKLRCPGPWDKCNLSEYNNKYVPHELCPVQSIKPLYKPFFSEGPAAKDTTHRTDYIPFASQPPLPFKPQPYIQPEGFIDSMTSYRSEFGPKEICPPKSIKPTPRRDVPAKFDGDTTNRTDYRSWDLPKRHVHVNDSYLPSADKFEDIGSYQRDYIPHCLAPSQSCKPLTTFMQSNEPMAQNTDYRETYVSHPLERRVQKEKPCHAQNRVPLDSLTTHKSDFTLKEICRVKDFKPPPHYIQNDKPLSEETTNRVDFRAHDVEKPFKYDREKYMKPTGDMDLKTTYNKDFTDRPACKTYSVKPPKTKTISAPFDGITNYRNDFKKFDVAPIKKIVRDCFEPSTDPFQDCTTSKTDYVPHEICRVKSFKPPPLMPSTNPFDDSTMYRLDFTKKNPPRCPAAYLNTNPRSVSPDGYIYQNEDQTGHLHYRRGSIPADGSLQQDNNANNTKEVLSVEPKSKPSVILPLLKV